MRDNLHTSTEQSTFSIPELRIKGIINSMFYYTFSRYLSFFDSKCISFFVRCNTSITSPRKAVLLSICLVGGGVCTLYSLRRSTKSLWSVHLITLHQTYSVSLHSWSLSIMCLDHSERLFYNLWFSILCYIAGGLLTNWRLMFVFFTLAGFLL